MKNVQLCFVFSWRELDSLSGVSKYQEGPHALSLNNNNIQHQPNGEGLDNEEEVCILFHVFFYFTFTYFTFIHLADSFIQSDLQIRTI